MTQGDSKQPRPPWLSVIGSGDAPVTRGELGPLLTAVQVARILAVRPKRVYELGIPAVRISSKSLRWRQEDLEIWLEQRKGAA
jgi:predicted DNA-binding transcriptional regulator AlpA